MKQKLRLTAMLWPILTILTIMCLYARAQRPEPSGPVLSGIVADTAGRPISGATVAVKGTSAKIVSGRDGRFSFHAPQQSGTLIISFLGHETIHEKFSDGNAGPYRFTLVPTESMLEEVEVSTGYQTIPKERATGSFEFVDTKLFNRRVSTDIISRLDGIVPGLWVQKSVRTISTSDIPFASIRGTSTMGAQKWPLIILDDFPYEGNFNNINPNDVESITVLKDAAASSIWGAKSGNGVIVIKTKRGGFNKPMQMSITTNTTIVQKPNLYYLPQISTSDYIDVELFLYENGYYDYQVNDIFSTVYPTIRILADRDNGSLTGPEATARIDALRSVDKRDDFLKYIYRNAVNNQAHFNLNGGADNLSYTFSAGFDKNLNNLVTSSYKRTNLRSQLNFKPVRNLTLDFGALYTENKYSDINSESRVDYFSLGLGELNPPYMKLAGPNGEPLAIDMVPFNAAFRDTVAGGRLLDWKYRPLAELDASSEIHRTKEMLINVGASYRFTPAITASVRYNYTAANSKVESWHGLESFNQRYLINYYSSWDDGQVYNPIPVGDRMGYRFGNTVNQTARLQVNIDKTWSDIHSLQGIAGYELKENKSTSNDMTLWGYNKDPLTFELVDHVNRVPTVNGMDSWSLINHGYGVTALTNRYTSYFANLSYSLFRRYTLSLSARKDASNLFGVTSNNRGKPFWSAGLAWNIANEAFYNIQALERLSLRATYGYNGNVNTSISAYPTISYNVTPHPLTSLPYAFMSQPPNPNLKWEEVAMLNLGVDFGFAGSRLSGSVEYYQKWPQNLIAFSRIDPSSGFTSLRVNSANLFGKGIDINLRSLNLQRADFSWRSDALLSYNRTVVTRSLSPSTNGSDFVVGASGVIQTPIEGGDIYGVYTYRWAGLDPETGDPLGYLRGELSKDYTSLTNPDVDDIDFHGSALPRYFGSLRNTVRYRQFELSANLICQWGFKFLRDGLNYNSLFIGKGHRDFAKRWQKPGDEANTHVPSLMYPIRNARSIFYEFSSALVEKGDFIKLRDVELSYTLPFPESGKIKSLQVRSYIFLNQLIWTANDKGIDPEYGNELPQPKSYALGLTLNF